MTEPYDSIATVRTTFPDARPALRPYQTDALDSAREALRSGARAVLLVAPTGSGKTIIGAEVARATVERGGSVVWLAHRAELLDQAAAKLSTLGLSVSVVRPGEPERPGASVHVCSVQTLRARGVAPPASMLIIDECVTGDTIVGGKRAASVRVGDTVESWDGERVCLRRVTHRFVNRAATLRTICVEGRSLTVTDNHPVWVAGKGYVNAGEVEAGDLCRVWGSDHEKPRAPEEDVLQIVSQQGSRTDGRQDEPHSCSGENDREQPDAKAGIPSKDVQHATLDRSQAEVARRKRTRTDGAPVSTTHGTRRTLDHGAHGQNPKGNGAAERGQDRHCEPTTHGGDRGGRWQSSLAPREGVGLSQNQVSRLARVDRVEVHEPGGDGSFGGRAPDGVVYNFEVDGEHNFFADGILTHNCHHYAADDWGKVLDAYPQAYRIGLSATPVRSDGRGLADAFDRLVTVTTIADLVADGHLVPCRVIAPETELRSHELAQTPCAAYLEHCEGRKTVVFELTVHRAEKTVSVFREHDVDAVVIHGGLSAKSRAAALRAHDAGAVLVNVYVLTEGWDSPETSACILARGCGNVGTYLQIVGRVLRPAPGKTDALLVDLRGQAFHMHGAPDAPREWHLTHGIGSKRGADQYCQVCGSLLDDGYPCPTCSYVPDGYRAKPVRITGDELAERYAQKRAEPTAQRTESLARWIASARDRGHKPGAAAGKFKAVYGRWPTKEQRAEAEELARALRTARCAQCRIPIALPPGVVSVRAGWRCARCR